MTRLRSPTPRGRRPPMTYEQFLKWDGENQHVEWVKGKVVPLPGVTGEHNEVGCFLICLFGSFVEDRGVGRVFHRPFQMKTGPDLPGRAPDLMVITNRSLRRVHEYYLDGPADIVVEIVDTASRKSDRGEKFREYQQGGVREYWLIDPERCRAEFFRRDRDRRFKPIAAGQDGLFASIVLKGLWLKVDWLWNRPPLAMVRRELGIVS